MQEQQRLVWNETNRPDGVVDEDHEPQEPMAVDGEERAEALARETCGRFGMWIPPRIAGLTLVFVSGLIFSVMSLMVHLLGPVYDATLIAFFRFIMQGLLATAAVLYKRDPNGLLGMPENRKYLISRAIFGTGGMISFYYTLGKLPMGDSVSIMFSNPVFTALLAWLLLGERFHCTEAIATALCFVGVVFIAKPVFLFGSQGDDTLPGAGSHDGRLLGDGDETDSDSTNRVVAVVIGIFGAISAALAFLSVRQMGRKEDPNVMAVYFAAIGLVASAALGLGRGAWVMPNWGSDGAQLALIGVMGFFGQWFLNRGMQLERAGPASLMRNIDVVLAFVYQVTLLGEPINGWSIAGALLITSCTALVAWSKSTRGADAAAGAGDGDGSEGTGPIPDHVALAIESDEDIWLTDSLSEDEAVDGDGGGAGKGGRRGNGRIRTENGGDWQSDPLGVGAREEPHVDWDVEIELSRTDNDRQGVR